VKRFAFVIATTGLVSATLLASGAFGDSSTTTSLVTLTSTPVIASGVHLAPLTGLPDPSGVTAKRPAITVKIDNTQEAHPQVGIDKADVIYEEIVEGGITRLAAIFNSQLPTKVGPVRSVRRTDREIVYPLGGVFAFSGGAAYAVTSIETAPVKLFQQSNSGGAMFRDPTRPPPHNLFVNAALLVKMAGKLKSPQSIFQYRPAGSSASGTSVSQFTVGFEAGYAATYSWSGKSKSWNRSLFGRNDVTADGARLSPKNVIVMKVNYKGGVGVIESQAVLTGSGPVEVFSGGKVQVGTWSRSNLFKPIAYRHADGSSILLSPGQTFVELLANSENVAITLAK
jgi:hypothetical protein